MTRHYFLVRLQTSSPANWGSSHGRACSTRHEACPGTRRPEYASQSIPLYSESLGEASERRPETSVVYALFHIWSGNRCDGAQDIEDARPGAYPVQRHSKCDTGYAGLSRVRVLWERDGACTDSLHIMSLVLIQGTVENQLLQKPIKHTRETHRHLQPTHDRNCAGWTDSPASKQFSTTTRRSAASHFTRPSKWLASSTGLTN